MSMKFSLKKTNRLLERWIEQESVEVCFYVIGGNYSIHVNVMKLCLR